MILSSCKLITFLVLISATVLSMVVILVSSLHVTGPLICGNSLESDLVGLGLWLNWNPGQNKLNASASLWDPTSLRRSWWPSGQKFIKMQWLTSGEWDCPLNNDPKLAIGKPHSRYKKTSFWNWTKHWDFDNWGRKKSSVLY